MQYLLIIVISKHNKIIVAYQYYRCNNKKILSKAQMNFSKYIHKRPTKVTHTSLNSIDNEDM